MKKSVEFVITMALASVLGFATYKLGRQVERKHADVILVDLAKQEIAKEDAVTIGPDAEEVATMDVMIVVGQGGPLRLSGKVYDQGEVYSIQTLKGGWIVAPKELTLLGSLGTFITKPAPQEQSTQSDAAPARP